MSSSQSVDLYSLCLSSKMSTILWFFVFATFVECTRSALPEYCTLPPDSGPCTVFKQRYYYDPFSRECVSFSYGSCDGNKNRFCSKQDCLDACRYNDPDVAPYETFDDFCLQPPVTGPCPKALSRFYYDPATDSCKQFTYSGCGGKDNRFVTGTECESQCKAAPIISPCNSPDVCSLPPDYGTCDDPESIKYYFNQDTRTCEQFTYGGCGGNENNFGNKEDCENYCDIQSPAKFDKVCYLQAKPGNCPGEIPSYFFNITTSQCELFIYGGCDGNANRFSTWSECNKICSNKAVRVPCEPPMFCRTPSDKGSCDDIITRWHLNLISQQCEPFIYGGCGGNTNNFVSKRECQNTCKIPQTPPCSQPCFLQPDSGPCDLVITRYFFNITTNQCYPYRYGGCGSNDNRFNNNLNCLAKCEDSVTD